MAAAEDPYMLAADPYMQAVADPYGVTGGGDSYGAPAAPAVRKIVPKQAGAWRPAVAPYSRPVAATASARTVPASRPALVRAPAAALRPPAPRPAQPGPSASPSAPRPTVVRAARPAAAVPGRAAGATGTPSAVSRPAWATRAPQEIALDSNAGSAGTLEELPTEQTDLDLILAEATALEQELGQELQDLNQELQELRQEPSGGAAAVDAALGNADAAAAPAPYASMPEPAFEAAAAPAPYASMQEATEAAAEAEAAAMEVADEADDGVIWEDTVGEAVDLRAAAVETRRAAADYSDVAELPTEPTQEELDAVSDAVSSNGDMEEEPPWLAGLDLPNDGGTAAMDAEVTGGFLDGLEDQNEDPDDAYPQYVPRLAQYLIGHPQALITKRRRKPAKGSGKRYYAEEKTNDVMADKTVTGCWACGKLDHESHECEFKRCFICSEQGHEQTDCGMGGEFCKRCNSRGHTEEFCPEQAYYEGLGNDVDIAFCSCMFCGEEGHLNCCEVPMMSAPSSGPRGKGKWAPSQPPWAQQALGNGAWSPKGDGGWRPGGGGHSAGPYGKPGPYGKGSCGKPCGKPNGDDGAWLPGPTKGGKSGPRPPSLPPPSWGGGGAKGGSPPWASAGRVQLTPRAPVGGPPSRHHDEPADDEDEEEDKRWASLSAGLQRNGKDGGGGKWARPGLVSNKGGWGPAGGCKGCKGGKWRW